MDGLFVEAKEIYKKQKLSKDVQRVERLQAEVEKQLKGDMVFEMSKRE